MGFFKKLFGGSEEQKPKTNLDHAKQIGGQLIVSRFRQLAKANNCAPTTKTTDQKIMEIYQQVGTAFRQEANNRGERITAGNLNSIVFKFIQVYELVGDQLFNEHLEYEIDKFHREGLRADYRDQEIELF